MFKICFFNGLRNSFSGGVYESTDKMSEAQVVLVRSQKMSAQEIGPDVLAIARAGAGVNNIPVEECSKKGVVVFNTPGANANAVKELALAGLFLAARRIAQGTNFVHLISDEGERIPKMVEEDKKRYAGIEISGKTLGVLGLGQIGSLVANSALSLGMRVSGYDPFVTKRALLSLDPRVVIVEDFDKFIATCDFLSIHIPLTDETRGFLGIKAFHSMKKGVRIVNMARAEIVDEEALPFAIKTGTVEAYVTDFPNAVVLQSDKIVGIPHLGASTAEAEENCLQMATSQVRDFLEKGMIRNSVNFPNMEMEPQTVDRLLVMNENRPGMVEHISSVLSAAGINIAEMANRSRGGYAVTLVDIDDHPSREVLSNILDFPGITRLRHIRVNPQ